MAKIIYEEESSSEEDHKLPPAPVQKMSRAEKNVHQKNKKIWIKDSIQNTINKNLRLAEERATILTSSGRGWGVSSPPQTSLDHDYSAEEDIDWATWGNSTEDVFKCRSLSLVDPINVKKDGKPVRRMVAGSSTADKSKTASKKTSSFANSDEAVLKIGSTMKAIVPASQCIRFRTFIVDEFGLVTVRSFK